MTGDPGLEDVVDPGLRIVDPHHHLWSYPERSGFQPVYLLDELHADTGSGHFVDKTVFVECGWAYRTGGPAERREVGETEFVAGVAEESARRGGTRIAGIVASCDLRLGDRLPGVLDAHEEAARGLFRGIRHRLAHDPTGSARTSRTEDNPPALMTDDDFRAGVELLGRRGLSFDAWIYHVQLPELIELAGAVPDTTIVLDHIGAPLAVGAYENRRDVVHAEWREHLVELASCSNVVVKLGGVGMKPYGSGWAGRDRPASSGEIVAEWGEALRFIIDTFGADRCMFESNFPVDKVSYSYRTMWNAYKTASADLPAHAREQLFAGTAERIYRV
jgi:predicted TIM-barrel fold metal-dependent hydrolase